MQFWKTVELWKLHTRSRRGVGNFMRHTALKILLTLVEIRQPSIVLSFVLFAIVVTALHSAEARCAFRTRLRVTDFVTASLTYAELSAVCGLWMVTLSLNNRDPCATSSRTLAPRSPLTPTTVDLPRSIDDGYAFLILTPLYKE